MLSLVHGLYQRSVPRRHCRFGANSVERNVRNHGAAAETQGQLVSKRYRLIGRKNRSRTCHEAGIVIALGTVRLAELNRVLCLKMASAHVVGADVGCESDLLLLPKRINGFLKRRVDRKSN